MQLAGHVTRGAIALLLCSVLLPLLPGSKRLTDPYGLSSSSDLCTWNMQTLAYVYLGSIGQAAQSGLSPTKLTLYIIGGIATLGASKVIADIAGQQIRDDDSSPEQAQLQPGGDDDP